MQCEMQYDGHDHHHAAPGMQHIPHESAKQKSSHGMFTSKEKVNACETTDNKTQGNQGINDDVVGQARTKFIFFITNRAKHPFGCPYNPIPVHYDVDQGNQEHKQATPFMQKLPTFSVKNDHNPIKGVAPAHIPAYREDEKINAG